MKSWEYLRVPVTQDPDSSVDAVGFAKFNYQGKLGWELVSVTYENYEGYQTPVGYFKREFIEK